MRSRCSASLMIFVAALALCPACTVEEEGKPTAAKSDTPAGQNPPMSDSPAQNPAAQNKPAQNQSAQNPAAQHPPSGSQAASPAQAQSTSAGPEWEQLVQRAKAAFDDEDTDKAVELANQALELARSKAGKEHPSVATSLLELGRYYQETGEPELAPVYFRDAVSIREKSLGADHLDTGMALLALGKCLNDHRKYKQSEPILTRSLAILEQKLPADHPDLAAAHYTFGMIYLLADNVTFPEGEPHLEQALAIRIKAFGPESREVKYTHWGLAYVLKKHGKFAQAEPHMVKFIAMEEKSGMTENDLLLYKWDLAMIFLKQGKLAEADPHIDRVLELTETSNSGLLVSFLKDLEKVYRETGAQDRLKAVSERLAKASQKVPNKK